MVLKPSIVVPVFNRTDELRRALASLAEQTLSMFECYVIDDASTLDVAAIVKEFDDRFVYVRSEVNLGPSGARLEGFRRLSGSFMVMLDSDNELFPWALERAEHYLQSNPSVSGVSGLYVYPNGLRVRVGQGQRVITPADYARTGSSLFDMVGAVRANVVDEWLQKGSGYFATEFHQWLTYHMAHDHLVVDEPWGKYHEEAKARVSNSGDERIYQDIGLFVEEHRQLFLTDRCRPLDDFLQSHWLSLRRAGRPEGALVEEWMAARGLPRVAAVLRRLGARVPLGLPRPQVL
jgi:glycosyltransferase involved in cell wall biosynthesis